MWFFWALPLVRLLVWVACWALLPLGWLAELLSAPCWCRQSMQRLPLVQLWAVCAAEPGSALQRWWPRWQWPCRWLWWLRVLWSWVGHVSSQPPALRLLPRAFPCWSLPPNLGLQCWRRPVQVQWRRQLCCGIFWRWAGPRCSGGQRGWWGRGAEAWSITYQAKKHSRRVRTRRLC